MECSMPGFPTFTIYLNLRKLMSIKLLMSYKCFILCGPLLFLPSIFPSIRVFSNESDLCIRWTKYSRFSFSISPSNEYSWLISFRIDKFVPLEVQGTRKSLLQQHSSKVSILWCSAFLMVQLSHPYITTGKTIALTRHLCQTSNVSTFNMLFRFVIAILPRSKNLLISWMQSPSAVSLEPKKISLQGFHCFPIYLPWRDGTRCQYFSFLNVEF